MDQSTPSTSTTAEVDKRRPKNRNSRSKKNIDQKSDDRKSESVNAKIAEPCVNDSGLGKSVKQASYMKGLIENAIQNMDEENQEPLLSAELQARLDKNEVNQIPTVEELEKRTVVFRDLIDNINTKMDKNFEEANNLVKDLTVAHHLAERRRKSTEQENRENFKRYKEIENIVSKAPKAFETLNSAVRQVPKEVEKIVQIENKIQTTAIVEVIEQKSQDQLEKVFAALDTRASKKDVIEAIQAQSEWIKKYTDEKSLEVINALRKENEQLRKIQGEHPCKECPRVFARASNLKRHVISKHEVLRNCNKFQMVCSIPNCGMKSRINRVMEKHRKEHNDAQEGFKYSTVFVLQCPLQDCKFMTLREGQFLLHLMGHQIKDQSLEPVVKRELTNIRKEVSDEDKKYLKRKGIHLDENSSEKWSGSKENA